MDCDDLDGIALSIYPTFFGGCERFPFLRQIADKTIKPLDAIGSRPLEERLDVRGSAGAAVALANRQDRSNAQALDSLCQQ